MQTFSWEQSTQGEDGRTGNRISQGRARGTLTALTCNEPLASAHAGAGGPSGTRCSESTELAVQDWLTHGGDEPDDWEGEPSSLKEPPARSVWFE